MKVRVKKAPILLRICARAIDYSVFFLFEALIASFLPFSFSDFFYLYAIFITLILWIPLEAYLLSTWGTTMGRTICDIFVRSPKGRMISYKNALMKACFLKKSEAYAYTETLKLRLVQWVIVIGIIVACWAATILGIPEINKYTNVYKSSIFISGWIPYQDFDKGYSILLPSYPDNKSEVLNNPYTRDVLNYNEAKSCDGEKVCYIVGYLDLPLSWRFAGADKLLSGSLDIIVKQSPGTSLVSSQLVRYHGNPAINFLTTNGDTEEKGTITLIGRTLYRIMVSAPKSNTPPNFQHFLDSFQLQYQGIGFSS